MAEVGRTRDAVKPRSIYIVNYVIEAGVGGSSD
jgi:hypothetical protein